ncbi:hypothetical protein CH251_00490 [Rhodococcus sp. 06-462-5]|uniref:hypothetical protein n=1 Tax=unclassified Rhodococcus (in: high G+C Gram-positive bacteria) TaxID=192944 RepID=UPI000B9A46F4|nr:MULTISPECIES: hypothetical protein [unclassified Rhodococcus (in: high G+C Gram-positive bacteria)]OZC79419.1 hypothetical protein CH251_00490 [Rhodococcus sp. 06-462-5]OZE59976.1 hypothetical protein CH270_22430 [Rhodococcus sp. 02-925g]
MRALVGISTISVVCSASITLYAAAQLATIGIIETGPLFEIMVVLPAVAAIVTSLLGALVGLGVLVRSSTRRLPCVLMAVGHLAASVGVVAVVLWATRPSASGWDLLFLPAPVVLGQLVVLAGLGVLIRLRQRSNSVRGQQP